MRVINLLSEAKLLMSMNSCRSWVQLVHSLLCIKRKWRMKEIWDFSQRGTRSIWLGFREREKKQTNQN